MMTVRQMQQAAANFFGNLAFPDLGKMSKSGWTPAKIGAVALAALATLLIFTKAVTSLAGRITKNLPIRGTVYIANWPSGLVGKDKTFSFSKNITLLDGTPVKIDDKTFYVEVTGDVTWNFKRLFDLQMGCETIPAPRLTIFLPSTLFNFDDIGTKGKPIISFLYRGERVDLTCDQSIDPKPNLKRLTFKETFDYLQLDISSKQVQCLFDADMDKSKILFGTEFTKVGSITEDNGLEEVDLGLYDDDQAVNGLYQEITNIASYVEEHWVFPSLHSDRMPLKDVQLVHVVGPNRNELLVIIPHKPEFNRLRPDAGRVTFGGGGRPSRTIYASEFQPQKGDRLPHYLHGQYARIRLDQCVDLTGVSVGYTKNGLLKLTKP